jgi:hypothetical protein
VWAVEIPAGDTKFSFARLLNTGKEQAVSGNVSTMTPLRGVSIATTTRRNIRRRAWPAGNGQNLFLLEVLWILTYGKTGVTA